MFLRVRRLFGIFAAWHLPADGPASRASRLRLFIYFIVLSVNAFPHALRWVRHRDPTARARVKQLLNLSGPAPLALDSRLFDVPAPAPEPGGVTLVMPVYGNLSLVQDALTRVVAHTEIPWRMVLVDDASPDTETVLFLRNWASRHGAHLIENERNLGFVSSANLGLEQAMLWPDPVVLLNSDAFLPEAWAPRLLRPLLEDPRIASVTPLSNDAELGSVPSPGLAALVTFDEAQALDRFAQNLNGRAQVVAPTSVGFCMAMSRTALELEPSFDPAFTPGYGEEVDWCQRLRARGFSHVYVPDLYVAHLGGQSFGQTQKHILIRRNSALLAKRYPRFDVEVCMFLRRDPLVTARLAVGIARAELQRNGAVPIYLGHSMGGGADIDLQRRLATDVARVGAGLVIRVGGNYRFTIELHHSQADGTLCVTSAGTEDWDLVERLLAPVSRRELVYSCAVGDIDPVVLPELFLSLKGPEDRLTVLVHDYFALSPNMTLLEENEQWQGLPEPTHASSRHVARRPNGRAVPLVEWRNAWRPLVDRAERVICFSSAAKMLFAEVYKDARIEVCPHNLHVAVPALTRPAPGAHPVLGILGNLAPHKGAAVAERLARACRNSGCEVVLLGEIDPAYRLPLPARKHGAYGVGDLSRLAARYGITCWLIPSLWPETFSFTTHEALATGLPIMVFDLGGQAEAVRAAEARGAPVALLPLGLAEDPQAILTRARHLSHWGFARETLRAPAASGVRA
ncbi:glycosyltransferase [Roseovarius sp.]|uniref:glycosyltransferase n=1 Tax=Roseovarius sp. TaxID=1486281 RepID=UPI0025796AB1|nr:glycosyltransferase [Roseovarius sp.]